MKLEIELDLNKIDYESIGKQIADKVAELNIKEEYDINSKIDNRISKLIDDEVDLSYNKYIDRYWRDATGEGRSLIQDMSKEEIKKRTNKIIDEIFANEFNEEALRDIVLQVMPNVFTSILFERLETALFKHEQSYYDQTGNMIRSMIDNAFNTRRY